MRKLIILKICLLVPLAIAAMSATLMLLWNWVTPALFSGAREIDFLHAVGLLVLCRILFGGFRGRGGWHGHGGCHRHGGWGRHGWWRMTPEEREQFADKARGMRGRAAAPEREHDQEQ